MSGIISTVANVATGGLAGGVAGLFSGPGGDSAEVNAQKDTASQFAQENQARAKEQYDWAKDLSGHVLDVANRASGRDFTMADDASSNATDLWNQYKTLFSPINEQVVKDAANYDSESELGRVRQEAAGNANVAFDTAQTSRNVDLQHMGVNPNSGRYVDPTAMAIARTTGVGDSMNRAVAGRKDAAIALRQGVAQFGTGVANLGNTARAIALNATNAGTVATNAAATVASGIRTQPAAWANAGNTAINTAGNLAVGGINANTEQYGAQTKRGGGLLSLAGQVIGVL